MRGKELVKILEKEGWVVHRIRGSHHILVKDNLTVSVPCHNTDLKPGLLHSILRQAGLK